MSKRLILCVVLTLTLFLSLNPAQASPLETISDWLDTPPAPGRTACSPETKVKEIYFKDSDLSEASQQIKPMPRWDEGFRLPPLSPIKPAIPSSNSPAPLTTASLLAARPEKRLAEDYLAARLLAQARQHLNAPYRRGASLRQGRATDCSGFVQYIYRNFNIELPRSSAEQSQVGKTAARRMDFDKLQPGDLLFFKRGRNIGHVGIYMGEGKMIHASDHRRGVTITDLRQERVARTFVMAKRVLEAKTPR